MDEDTLRTWSHHLAQRHLAGLAQHTTSSPPAPELPVLLHLAEQVPSSQLPLEVLLDLAIVFPPWPQQSLEGNASSLPDPIRALFEKHRVAADGEEDDGGLTPLAGALLTLPGSADASLRVVLAFAFLRMGGDAAVRAVVTQADSAVQRLLEDLTRTYASDSTTLSVRLFVLHSLSILLGVTSDTPGSIPLPPLSAITPVLPSPSSELPRPFTSLWSDVETLFGLSSRVIDAPGWGDVAMQLLQLEGDRKEWEDEALRLEQLETVYPSSSNPPPPTKPTDPVVLASVEQIQAILPDLSAAFIIAAVAHPYFTSAPPSGAPSQTVEERIIEAIFDAAPLPDDLDRLRHAPAATHEEETMAASLDAVDTSNDAELLALARARREQAEEATGGAVDDAQVYNKAATQGVPQISEAVPQSVRESIMRLVEVQREEQEEEEREERERQASRMAAAAAAGKTAEVTRTAEEEDIEDDEHVSARMRGAAMIGADGELSGDDDDPDAVQAAPSGAVPMDSDSLLEELYLSNKKVFDRDGATRRGKDRAALKEKTGFSDEQIEGWKIMLERNPRRMASIQARLGMFTPSASATSTNSAKPPSQPSANHANGSNSSSRGGRGGGRGGRGRGENKSSRGHQNSARKRGNDRKMAMQGPKA